MHTSATPRVRVDVERGQPCLIHTAGGGGGPQNSGQSGARNVMVAAEDWSGVRACMLAFAVTATKESDRLLL